MSLHRPMAVDPDMAQQWMDAMQAAIAAQGWPEERLASELGEALSRMARAMIARS